MAGYAATPVRRSFGSNPFSKLPAATRRNSCAASSTASTPVSPPAIGYASKLASLRSEVWFDHPPSKSGGVLEQFLEVCSHAARQPLESVRVFLDSRHGRHFADDVLNELHAGATLPDAIHAATQRWMGWTIGRQTSKHYGIRKRLPYLTGFVIHCVIVEESLAD